MFCLPCGSALHYCGWLEAHLSTSSFAVFVTQFVAILNKCEKSHLINSIFYLIAQYAKSFQSHSSLVNQLDVYEHQKHLEVYGSP